MVAALLLLLTSCTPASVDSAPTPQTGTAAPTPTTDDVISVVVQMPTGDHTEPVDGWVVDATGATVAQFQFDAAVRYERIGEGYGSQDFDATRTYAPRQLSIELPGSGPFEFHVGPVEYFGGCGTCGRFHQDGGAIEREVADGTVVRLDVGPVTAES